MRPGKDDLNIRLRNDRTTDQKAAAAAFLDGLWSDPVRRARFVQAMEANWEDFKNTAEYESLRADLARVMKGPRR